MFTSPQIFRLLLAVALFAPIDAMSQRRLPPCPDTPNCVSTDAERESQRMLAVPFTDSPESAFARAKAAVLAESRVGRGDMDVNRKRMERITRRLRGAEKS